MDLQADIKWIQKELQEVDDPTFLEAIKNMFKYRKKISTTRISVEQYNNELDQSINQIENGKVYTHQEIGERIKQWGRK